MQKPRFEGFQQVPIAEFAVANPNGRRKVQRVIAVPAPQRHGRNSKFPTNLGVRDQLVDGSGGYCSGGIGGIGGVLPLKPEYTRSIRFQRKTRTFFDPVLRWI